MDYILKVRDKKGTFIGIPAIVGPPGKSAYESALDGGFIGTEEEFNQAIAELMPNTEHNHSADSITSGTLNIDRLPTVSIEKGGTGANTAELALANLGGAKFQTGSYDGIGGYGANNPNILTLNFKPKFLCIYSGEALMFVKYGDRGGAPLFDTEGGHWGVYFTWSSNTVTWYNPETGKNETECEKYQFNLTTTTYSYFAIG